MKYQYLVLGKAVVEVNELDVRKLVAERYTSHHVDWVMYQLTAKGHSIPLSEVSMIRPAPAVGGDRLDARVASNPLRARV